MLSVVLLWVDSFLRTPQLLAAASLAVAVWAIVIVVLVRRTEGTVRRSILLLTSGLYLMALLAFINPPTLTRATGIATLITAGAGEAALEAISPDADVYVIDEVWSEALVAEFIRARSTKRDAGRLVRIATVDGIRAYQPDLAKLRVIGDGLTASAWRDAAFSGDVEFVPGKTAMGIAGVSFENRIAIGEAFNIGVALTEVAAGAGLSLSVQAEDGRELGQSMVDMQTDSRLAVTGLSPGLHQLSVRLLNPQSEQLIEAVTVPVEVYRPPLARLLMLQAAPSFEWRSLTRWAAESGAALAARVTISDARVRTRVSDGFDFDPGEISRATLRDIDLVIADGAALKKLSDVEREALLSEAHGAGVLLLLHDEADFDALPETIASVLSRGASDEVVYRLPQMGLGVATGLSRASLSFDVAATTPLLRDERDDVIVARLQAIPHVAVSLVRDSYRLVGAGEADVHARVWSGLTQAMARPSTLPMPTFDNSVSRVHERLRVCLPQSAGIDRLQIASIGDDASYALALHTMRARPGEVCSWFWPPRAGWLRIEDSQGAALATHFITSNDDWRTQRKVAKISATSLRANAPVSAEVSVSGERQVPISRDWPLLALLLLSAAAWLIQRLSMARRQA